MRWWVGEVVSGSRLACKRARATENSLGTRAKFPLKGLQDLKVEREE